MKIRSILLVLITFLAFQTTQAQTQLNSYKYVVVPKKFDFLKDEDQYRLNTLTKLLFEKYGFAVLMDDAVLPDDAATNNCLMLNSNVVKERGVFNTKLKIELKNCKNETVYVSNIGQSREKKFQVAYNLALREAFQSFETVNYSYDQNEAISGTVASTENDSAEVEKLKKEIKALKEEKKAVDKSPKQEIPETTENENTGNTTQVPDVTNMLYAQQITNGFQLVDSTPKVIYKMKKTGKTNVFLVEGMNAIIYKQDTQWILEYYKDNTLQTKVLQIKF